MSPHFRQSMAWLHTWGGLWLCWLLYAIFVTGTLAVFSDPITHWMKAAHMAPVARVAPPPRPQQLAAGLDYLAKAQPDAREWSLSPQPGDGIDALRITWTDRQGARGSIRLDPRSGQPMAAAENMHGRATRGGGLFVDFHYTLLGGIVGQWIVAIAAMAMLVTLTTGIITHKRIFKDIFTFRPAKGQRSWLDAHNAAAVLTLPFQFMIAFTGIALLWSTYMPAALIAHYGTGRQAEQRFSREFYRDDPSLPSGKAMALPPLEPFARHAERLIGQDIASIAIRHPGDRAARIAVTGRNAPDAMLHRLRNSPGKVVFDAASRRILSIRQPGAVDGDPASGMEMVLWALHMLLSGGWALRWLYFLCGLAGTAMMASGATLFMVKRRQKAGHEFGMATQHVYRPIEVMNVGMIAGLPVACAGYLWANRLIPAALAGRETWEMRAFFALWLATLLHAAIRTPRRAWIEQAGLLAALCPGVPILNAVTTGDQVLSALRRGDLAVTGVEMIAMGFGLGAAWTACAIAGKSSITPVRNRARLRTPARAAAE